MEHFCAVSAEDAHARRIRDGKLAPAVVVIHFTLHLLIRERHLIVKIEIVAAGGHPIETPPQALRECLQLLHGCARHRNKRYITALKLNFSLKRIGNFILSCAAHDHFLPPSAEIRITVNRGGPAYKFSQRAKVAGQVFSKSRRSEALKDYENTTSIKALLAMLKKAPPEKPSKNQATDALRKPTSPGRDFHAVGITSTSVCRWAAKNVAGKRVLMRAAPRLPPCRMFDAGKLRLQISQEFGSPGRRSSAVRRDRHQSLVCGIGQPPAQEPVLDHHLSLPFTGRRVSACPETR